MTSTTPLPQNIVVYMRWRSAPEATEPHPNENEPQCDVLPEDAPPGHEAHTKVKYNGTHKNPLRSESEYTRSAKQMY